MWRTRLGPRSIAMRSPVVFLRGCERSLGWVHGRAQEEDGDEENVTSGLWGAAARLEDQSVSRLLASHELRRSVVQRLGRAIRRSPRRHIGLARDARLRRPAT